MTRREAAPASPDAPPGRSGDVLVEVEGAVGRLRLNRPKAIHALTHAMCAAMGEALLGWARDPAIRLVLIDHLPAADGDPRLSRGFCAGGDIRAIWESGRGDGRAADAFFHEEYRLNHLLFTYPKPIVAVMDGITMGGGVGIAQPATFRVATERTVYAMPETGIGLFPDVGGGWYLSRLPGRVGEYLAATGARIDGAECMALGLATHYVPSARLDALKAALVSSSERAEALLADHAEEAPHPKIDAHRVEIDRLFAADGIEALEAAVAADPSDFAATTLDTLRAKSPHAVGVSLRLLAESRACTDFSDVMRSEYRIASRVSRMNDFLQGVRALIVDKTNDPRWNPATADGVTDALLDRIFAPLPDADEWTPYPRTEPRNG